MMRTPPHPSRFPSLNIRSMADRFRTGMMAGFGFAESDRQIQPREFSKRRRTLLLLRGRHPSPGPVKGEIPERVPVAGHAVARAEQQAEMLVDVVGTAEIERGKSLVCLLYTSPSPRDR